jgi:prepilin-type N-terminal cleavage/methylation domain-containing protein
MRDGMWDAFAQDTGRRGFSLIELMLVLMISALCLVASIPNFSRFKKTHDLRNAAIQVRNDLRLSQRVAAGRRIQRIVVMGSPDSRSYTIHDDTDRDGVADGGERLLIRTLPGSVTITSISLTPADSVIFVPTGRLAGVAQGGFLTLESDKGEKKWIRIWTSGTSQVVHSAEQAEG